MDRLRVAVAVSAVSISLFVAGCGGGGANVHIEGDKATLGTELNDIEDAYRKGVIDREEFERAKKKVLEQSL